MPVLILASGSSRRLEMLSRLTGNFIVSVPDIDEILLPDESPVNMVLRLAKEKALAVHLRENGKYPVLAADTIVVLEGSVLGKPDSREDAKRMISRLSGRKHKVITGVALYDIKTNETYTFAESTDVIFSNLTKEEINEYVKTDEPMDKAGAYGIQGDGGKFIERIDGCFYNVMGFPLNGIYKLLKKQGII